MTPSSALLPLIHRPIASAFHQLLIPYTLPMDAHALRTLEFPKILDRLARHAAFSAGKELALALTPSTDIREVVRRQRHTAEARRLMQLKPRTGLQGSHDVRPLAEKASRVKLVLI